MQKYAKKYFFAVLYNCQDKNTEGCNKDNMGSDFNKGLPPSFSQSQYNLNNKVEKENTYNPALHNEKIDSVSFTGRKPISNRAKAGVLSVFAAIAAIFGAGASKPAEAKAVAPENKALVFTVKDAKYRANMQPEDFVAEENYYTYETESDEAKTAKISEFLAKSNAEGLKLNLMEAYNIKISTVKKELAFIAENASKLTDEQVQFRVEYLNNLLQQLIAERDDVFENGVAAYVTFDDNGKPMVSMNADLEFPWEILAADINKDSTAVTYNDEPIKTAVPTRPTAPVEEQLVKYAPPPVIEYDEPTVPPAPVEADGPEMVKYAPPLIYDQPTEPIPPVIEDEYPTRPTAPVEEQLVKYAPPPIYDQSTEPVPPAIEDEYPTRPTAPSEPLAKYAPPPVEIEKVPEPVPPETDVFPEEEP